MNLRLLSLALASFIGSAFAQEETINVIHVDMSRPIANAGASRADEHWTYMVELEIDDLFEMQEVSFQGGTEEATYAMTKTTEQSLGSEEATMITWQGVAKIDGMVHFSRLSQKRPQGIYTGHFSTKSMHHTIQTLPDGSYQIRSILNDMLQSMEDDGSALKDTKTPGNYNLSRRSPGKVAMTEVDSIEPKMIQVSNGLGATIAPVGEEETVHRLGNTTYTVEIVVVVTHVARCYFGT